MGWEEHEIAYGRLSFTATLHGVEREIAANRRSKEDASILQHTSLPPRGIVLAIDSLLEPHEQGLRWW